MHVLAEGLQAGGSYLSAARRLHAERAGEARLEKVLHKAEREFRRAETAFRDLRTRLQAPRAPEAG